MSTSGPFRPMPRRKPMSVSGVLRKCLALPGTTTANRDAIGWQVYQTRRGGRFERDVLTVGGSRFLRASTYNSTSARSASKSSTGRNYRHCSDHGKTQDRRNNTIRHYTSSLAHSPKCRGLTPSNHKLERCCWAADDSRAESRSHASDRCAAYERARRTQLLAAVTRELHLIRRLCATLVATYRVNS